MAPEEAVKLGGGAVGYLAADPGQPGRFLWSVRWPAHACYKVRPKGNDAEEWTADKWHCATGEEYGANVPQMFRSGVADGESQARAAIEEAFRAGRPTSGDKQFVMYHRTG